MVDLRERCTNVDAEVTCKVCPTDLAKVRYYKCGGVGHISSDCKVAPTSDGKPTYQGKGSKGISPGKGPSNSNQKPKGFFFSVHRLIAFARSFIMPVTSCIFTNSMN
jgi:hypothetical protein